MSDWFGKLFSCGIVQQMKQQTEQVKTDMSGAILYFFCCNLSHSKYHAKKHTSEQDGESHIQ